MVVRAHDLHDEIGASQPPEHATKISGQEMWLKAARSRYSRHVWQRAFLHEMEHIGSVRERGSAAMHHFCF